MVISMRIQSLHHFDRTKTESQSRVLLVKCIKVFKTIDQLQYNLRTLTGTTSLKVIHHDYVPYFLRHKRTRLHGPILIYGL